jgi:beta-1,2-mannobiose phosphorylase / 1,2-beta-oligomannan phosphorylase
MLTRYKYNPIVTPSNVIPTTKEYNVIGAFNPAATLYKNEIILLLRVAETCKPKHNKIRVPVYKFIDGNGIPDVLEFNENDPEIKLKDTRGIVHKGIDYLSSISHIRIARSKDGFNFKVDKKPFIYPCSEEEKYGIEDARITFIDGLYYINYTIVSQDSWCTALSVTEDFKSHKRLGTIFHPENKDVTIFPEKINGKYAALHRPNNSGFGKPAIWYAESPDLLHWGMHRCVTRPRNTKYESMKIGAGSAPIKTPEGWLCIYHCKGDNAKYTLFPMLLDLEKPWIVKKQSQKPLVEPKADYEINGFFGNVIFTNGIVEKDNKLYIYYGAADDSACVLTTTVDHVLNHFN